VTRLPLRSPSGESEDLDGLEELGDDAIIAQQTAAHAPQPRANVSEESRSVVISDVPRKRDTQPPRSGMPKTTGEPTLIIRDRRALDEMRQQLMERQRRRKNRGRALYIWGALGVAAFVLGGLVAFLATDSHPTTSAAPAEPARAEAPVAKATAAAPSARPDTAPTHAVRLDDLPVEKTPKR